MENSILRRLSLYLTHDPFGMITYGREWQTGSDYRYGFNGQESENEISSEGNLLTFDFRIYNSTIGRFLSIDPLTRSFSWNSPYAFAQNRVIDGKDLEGKEWKSQTQFDFVSGSKTVQNTVHIKVVDNSALVTEVNRDAYMKGIQEYVSNTYNTYDPNTHTTYTYSVEYEFVETLKPGDFGLILYDDQYADEANTDVTDYNGITYEIGNSQNNTIEVKVGKEFIYPGLNPIVAYREGTTESQSIRDVSRTAAHELGHTVGLYHPWDPDNDVNDVIPNSPGVCNETIIDNIMNSPGNPDPSTNPDYQPTVPTDKVTIGQSEKITSTIESQNH